MDQVQLKFFTPVFEWALLSEVQSGNVSALQALVLGYLWFIKRLTDEVAGTTADAEIREGALLAVLNIFESEARQVSLDDPRACFLEGVFSRVRREVGIAERTRRMVRRLDQYQHIAESTDVVSLQRFVSDGSDTELQDMVADQCVPSVERVLWEEQLREGMSRIVARLPEDERRVMSLHITQDLSFGEIAEVLGCSAEQVRGKFGKTIRRLKIELAQSDYALAE